MRKQEQVFRSITAGTKADCRRPGQAARANKTAAELQCFSVCTWFLWNSMWGNDILDLVVSPTFIKALRDGGLVSLSFRRTAKSERLNYWNIQCCVPPARSRCGCCKCMLAEGGVLAKKILRVFFSQCRCPILNMWPYVPVGVAHWNNIELVRA